MKVNQHMQIKSNKHWDNWTLIEQNNIKNYHNVIHNLNHNKIFILFKSIINLIIITILIINLIIIKVIIIKYKNHNNRKN